MNEQSKTQIKKIAKRERIQAKYMERKMAAKKMKSDGAGPVSDNSRGWGQRQERNAMIRADFESNCERGPIIAIDCEWDDMMTDKERLSLTQQIMYSYAVNRKASKPGRLCIFGASQRQQDLLRKLPGFETWYVGLTADPITAFSNIQFDGIYLTADTENVLDLNSVQRDSVLIIGGIVDRNRYKNATVEKADSIGIRPAQLPIGDLMAMKSSKVLTVNHVFEILTEVFYHGDWAQALEKVIPERKKDDNLNS